jgi:hypothetical protein
LQVSLRPAAEGRVDARPPSRPAAIRKSITCRTDRSLIPRYSLSILRRESPCSRVLTRVLDQQNLVTGFVVNQLIDQL